MGTFLKIIGILTILFWVSVGVGCTMLGRAISHAGARHSTYQGVGANADVVRALQDGQVDTANLPSDIDVGPSATIPLRDGTSRTLGDSSRDLIVRAMLAQKAAALHRSEGSPYGSSSPYPYERDENRPHFKPGEPMVDPTPGGSSRYDD